MDRAKCEALKRELAEQPEPLLVEIERFFDGNDDLGSIGCNLAEHPGVETFKKVLCDLAGRPDVAAVCAQVYEIDPGEGSWPFSDTVFVAGTITLDELRRTVQGLQPDEVVAADAADGQQAGAILSARHGQPVWRLWWD